MRVIITTCSREVTQLFLILYNTHKPSFHDCHPWRLHHQLHYVSQIITPISCRWWGIHQGLLWRVASYWHQLIIQEVDLESTFQYLGACLHQRYVYFFRRQFYIKSLRPKYFVWCSTSNHLFTPCRMYCSILRAIIIISGLYRAC